MKLNKINFNISENKILVAFLVIVLLSFSVVLLKRHVVNQRASPLTSLDWRCRCPIKASDIKAFPESRFWTQAPLTNANATLEDILNEIDLYRLSFPTHFNKSSFNESMSPASSDGSDVREKADAIQEQSFNITFNRTIIISPNKSGSRAVLVMMTNVAQVDLTDHLLCSLRILGLNKYIVFATDDLAEQALIARGIRTYSASKLTDFKSKKLAKHSAGFGTGSAFTSLVRAKLTVQREVLSRGFDVVFQDVDIAWKENVLPEIFNTSGEAIWMDDADDMHMKPRLRRPLANSGFFFIKASKQQRAFFNAMLRIEKRYKIHDDQKLVNRALPIPMKRYFDRVGFANGCNLNNLAKHGKLPGMKDTLLEHDRVARYQDSVKVAHMSCATSKEMKFGMFCQHRLWYCNNAPHLSNSKKARSLCSYLSLKKQSSFW